MAGCDQDVEMQEATAMAGGDLTLKMEAVAIRGDGDQYNLKTSGRSESGDTSKRRNKPWEEEGAILRLKKEVLAAMDQWFRVQSSPERMARKDAQQKAQASLGARKKKKTKVVRTKLTKEFIDKIAAHPFNVYGDLSDEELAQRTPFFREVYPAVKIYEAKNREYWRALKAQQDELGYAEDEIEVTDDEEEEAVKN